MMNVADSSSRPTLVKAWADSPIHIEETDVLVGEYTFGPSNKCLISLDFTDLVIPGLTGRPGDRSTGILETGCGWLQIRSPNDGLFAMSVSSGFFNFDPGPGTPTTSAGGRVSGRWLWAPTSYASWSTFGDIATEVFQLRIAIDRSTAHTGIVVDFRTASGNIVLANNRDCGTNQGDDTQIPTSFTFKAGSRLDAVIYDQTSLMTHYGAYNFTITEFKCEDVA